MPTHKAAPGASENSGRTESDDLICVIDPELEVRDGGVHRGNDKDIDVELKDPSGPCEYKVDNSSEVFTKHKVRWWITNNCGSDRKVEITFPNPEGSPLEPCTLEATVPKGKKEKIECEIRDDADFRAYGYEIVVTAPKSIRTD